MKFISEMKLSCGHEITFGNCGDPGNEGQITHQKDAQIVQAYSDYFSNDMNCKPPTRILEIGICRGGSLAIWREMFNSCEIVGVDNKLEQIKPWSLDHFRENNQIQIHHMNMPDPDIKKLGMFDLIIDDGEHGAANVLPTFEYCWPMLNYGGTYIVEDWIANDESKMINHFINKMVGYWPNPMPIPNTPFSIMIYRAFFAIRKEI